jgi:hypothetical protein
MQTNVLEWRGMVIDLLETVGQANAVIIVIIPGGRGFPGGEKEVTNVNTEEAAALGFYTDGQSKLREVLAERGKLLRQLKAMADVAENFSGGIVVNFDLAVARDIMAQLTEVASRVTTLVNEINANAAKCGRSTVEVRTVQTPRTF